MTDYDRQIDRDFKTHTMVFDWAIYTGIGTLAACYIWALVNRFVQTFGFTLFLYGTYWAGKFIVEVVIEKIFYGGDDE